MSEEEFRAAVCAEVVQIFRESREKNTISMNALAKKAGLTQPTISILEGSQPNPKLDSLLRMARALDLNLGEVVKKAIRRVESRGTNKRTSNRPSNGFVD